MYFFRLEEITSHSLYRHSATIPKRKVMTLFSSDEEGSSKQITQVTMNVFKMVCLAAHSREAVAIGGILVAVWGGVPEVAFFQHVFNIINFCFVGL